MIAELPGRPELKQVTVLVADLVDSTGLIAGLEAEAAMNRLAPILQIMSDAVARFGGTVVSTQGDSVLAVFGAPVALEGHAVLACRAALAIRSALNADRDALSVRAGLHSGEIVAHTEPITRDEIATVFGVVLHVGSRLPAQVDPDEICLSESCNRLVRSHYRTSVLGRRTLRGVPHPILLYTLEHLAPSALAGIAGGSEPTPFVGRTTEMAALVQCLDDALSGRGALACIAGAPGSGKSRLCREFVERSRAAGVAVFEARSQPFGGTTPLKPVADLLRAAYFALPGGEPPETAVRNVRHTLEAIGSAPGDVALVCDLLDVPHDEAFRSFRDAASRRLRLLDILTRLVRWRGDAATILLLEDLHWLDGPSATFVAALARAIDGTRTMLLLNTRSGDETGAGVAGPALDLPGCRRIDLAELDGADIDRLLDRLLGPAARLSAIRSRIAEKSAGNPFFAEELVRSLADDGVLFGRPGAYVRGRTPDGGTLPATVQSVIAARIDHLARPEREALHLAAVIGKEFDVHVLHDVAGSAGRDAVDLQSSLDSLCAGSLLSRIGAGPRFAFGHPLIQDVAYSTQLKARRMIVHAAVARALERASIENREEMSGLIAFHHEEGGEGGEAARFAARAARKLGQTDAAAAVRQWHKVRELLAAQPRSAETDILRIEANGQIGWLGWREGLSAAEAKPFLEEALAWARETDEAIIPLLMLIEGRIDQVGGGNTDVFVAGVRQAIAIAETNGDAGRIATLHAQLSHAYGWAGLLREALAANDAALAGATEVSAFDQQLLGYSVEHWATALRGRILLRLGRLEDARACFEQTIALYDAIDPTVGFIAHLGYVEMALHLGDGPLASRHAGFVADLADKHGTGYLQLYSLTTHSYASAAANDWRRAIDQARQSLGFLHQRNVARELETELLAHIAECHRRDGSLEEAAAIARETIVMSSARKSRLPHARALVTLAAVAAEIGEAEAGSDAQDTLALAHKLIGISGAGLYRTRFNDVSARAGSPLRVSEGLE